MSNLTENHSRIPEIHIGKRIVKTVIAVYICLCIAYFRGGFANPFYIAIAAVMSIQSTAEGSRKAGINRLVATFFGGLWGVPVFMLHQSLFADCHMLIYYAFVAVMIIPLILTNLHFKWASAIATSCVVFLIITVTPSGKMTAMQFIFNRLLDTFLGVVVAMAVNSVKLPDDEELAQKIEARKQRRRNR